MFFEDSRETMRFLSLVFIFHFIVRNDLSIDDKLISQYNFFEFGRCFRNRLFLIGSRVVVNLKVFDELIFL